MKLSFHAVNWLFLGCFNNQLKMSLLDGSIFALFLAVAENIHLIKVKLNYNNA